jgi:transcriptional regulator with XRE-family HTH domain
MWSTQHFKPLTPAFIRTTIDVVMTMKCVEMRRTEQIELMKLRLGRALATARNARGWSQPHVAQLMGVDSETISRIERGHVVRLDRLYDLAVLYDIPIAALFHDAPGPRPDRIDEIVLALGLLDETNRQWVLDMVRAVTAKLER